MRSTTRYSIATLRQLREIMDREFLSATGCYPDKGISPFSRIKSELKSSYVALWLIDVYS